MFRMSTKISMLLVFSFLIFPKIPAGAEAYAVRTVVTDEAMGRSLSCINIDSQNTERAYFTQNMWTNDSKRFIVRNMSDGYLYEYNLETNVITKLMRSSANYYVTPSNFLYYVDSTAKTINRYHLDNKTTDVLTTYFHTYTNTPSAIHVTNDDSTLTVQWVESSGNPLDKEYDENNELVSRTRRIPVFDIINNQWDLRYSHEFSAPYPFVTHVIMNPIYKNLVFYCHEGTTQYIPDRLWVLNTLTGSQTNVFKQYYNGAGMTGEPSGHENWSFDGESLVFVKYRRTDNLGQSGIVRIDKNGDNREYINDDYKYWHCHPSNDNRFIVADTQVSPTEIVVVDSKTSKAHLVARINSGPVHPWQPHPTFSPDGKKVCYAMIGSDGSLCVGISDVSDITTTNDSPEITPKNTNEDNGFSATSVKTEIKNGKLELSTTLSAEKNLIFTSASYDNTGKLCDISVSDNYLNTLSDFSGKTIKNFLWDENQKPYSLTSTPPLRFRMKENGVDSIRLVWFPPKNLSDVSEYIIYRDNVEIGRVPDSYYIDSDLSSDTIYNYGVSAVFENGEESPSAFGKFSTLGIAYARLDNAISEENMHFVVNTANPNGDSYTEKTQKGGRYCYKSTSQLQPDEITIKTGKFYFQVSENYISQKDTDATVEITYFDEGTNYIYLQYNSPTSIAESKTIVKRTDTGQWKTASLSITNAEFKKAPALTNSDFRIEGGTDTYIYEVRVIKDSQPSAALYQSVSADFENFGIYNGLSLYISPNGLGDGATVSGTISGRSVRTAESGKNLYFNVFDDYMFGKKHNEATITFSYFDSGMGDIVLQYNSSDPTLDPLTTASKYKRLVIGTKTNTQKFKTITVKLIDANFSNLQDSPYFSDFRISASGGISIDFIKVLDKI